MMRTNKTVSQGSALLIPAAEWPPVSEITGTDLDILRHPVMERAFQRILDLHTVAHPIAYMSLCTTTRPYTKGRKWTFVQRHLGRRADLIVTSSGGVIPLRFEQCFPYLNYDAHADPQFDGVYIQTMERRFLQFFRRHRYRFVVFNYRPTLRNVRAARTAAAILRDEGTIEDYRIVPTEATVARAKAAQWTKHPKGCLMYPELYPTMWRDVEGAVREFESRSTTKEA